MKLPFKAYLFPLAEFGGKGDGHEIENTLLPLPGTERFIIQFYLRERFPSVALYKKKQNATIVLTRSLAIVFASNILIYFLLLLHVTLQRAEVTFSLIATCWLLVNLLFSGVLYMRFQQDKLYHAMYIFETFIAMKKLLKSKRGNAGTEEDRNV